MGGDSGSAGLGGSSGASVSGQDGGNAGMSGGSGGAGGHSGTGMTGGTSGGDGDGDDAGSDPATDGSTPDAAMDAGGDGDAAIGKDADTPDPDGPIAGKVIDYYENPVAGVIVRLNGEAATTNAAGEFAFEAAPPTYSLSLSLSFQRYGVIQHDGYMFVDLTRRDPTLQVLRGNPMRSGDFIGTITTDSIPLPSRHEIPFDIAGPHGGSEGSFTSRMIDTSSTWEGPLQVVAHVHAIHHQNSDTAPYLPIAYFAHDSEPFALDYNVETTFSLDLTSEDVLPTGIVSGEVTNDLGGDRTNRVFVRFPDDAAVRVVNDGTGPDAFTYLVPTLASSSIAVAAERGDTFLLPYAVAYVDGVTPGTTDIDLTIPTAATLEAPSAAKTNVDASTSFSWSGDDQVYMFVARAVNYFENYYVITANKSARLPIAEVSEPAYRSDHDYLWSVRTHLRMATVDEATGPAGYLDSYCYGRLRGPRRGAGTHTSTIERSFKSAP